MTTNTSLATLGYAGDPEGGRLRQNSTQAGNPNMQVEPWLKDYILISALVGLCLSVLTFIFQLTHSKSR